MYIPLMFMSVTGGRGRDGGLFGALVKTALILLVDREAPADPLLQEGRGLAAESGVAGRALPPSPSR